MQSTIRKCQYCGNELPFRELNIQDQEGKSGNAPRIYTPCMCDGAVAAREERERIELEIQAKLDEKNRLERLERAGVKKRFMYATHEYSDPLLKKLNSGKSLYIVGGFGTGKTHLASAIAVNLVNDRRATKIVTAPEFFMRLQETIGKPISEKDVFDSYAKTGYLIIDDLGKEPPSEWVLSRMYSIINYRYESLLPVIITTNYERSELVVRLGRSGDAKTAEAIVSRLCEMSERIPMQGEDRRLS